MSKKSTSSFDTDLGLKVRVARIQAGISQEKLGNSLGLTFQQVQKYEKGLNRITAYRLREIARITGVRLSSFYTEDWDIGTDPKKMDIGSLRFAEQVSLLPSEMRHALYSLADNYISAQRRLTQPTDLSPGPIINVPEIEGTGEGHRRL